MRKRAMGWEFAITKSDRVRVLHEKKSAGVKVDHEKNSDGVRVDHENKSDRGKLTMRKRAIR